MTAVLIVAAIFPLAYTPLRAQSYTVDTATSEKLTNYFGKHRLPLVGAQVLDDGAGGRLVMLYGYVATSFGKTDAEQRARKFLKQPGAKIENRIEIRPEIRNLKAPPTAPDEGGAQSSSGSREIRHDPERLAIPAGPV
jgi:hypothetical protein